MFRSDPCLVTGKTFLKVVSKSSKRIQCLRLVVSATPHPIGKLDPREQGLYCLGVAVAPPVHGIVGAGEALVGVVTGRTVVAGARGFVGNPLGEQARQGFDQRLRERPAPSGPAFRATFAQWLRAETPNSQSSWGRIGP